LLWVRIGLQYHPLARGRTHDARMRRSQTGWIMKATIGRVVAATAVMLVVTMLGGLTNVGVYDPWGRLVATDYADTDPLVFTAYRKRPPGSMINPVYEVQHTGVETGNPLISARAPVVVFIV